MRCARVTVRFINLVLITYCYKVIVFVEYWSSVNKDDIVYMVHFWGSIFMSCAFPISCALYIINIIIIITVI